MSSRPVPLDALCAISGPVVIGIIVGIRSGPFAAAHDALVTPAIVFGVTALMVPALYIATAFAGIAPPARGFAAAVGDGLRACGVALLGLSAPAAFLVATSENDIAGFVIGAAVVAAGILIGLRALYQRLFDGEPGRFVHVAIYGGWSALALLLGALFWVRGQAG